VLESLRYSWTSPLLSRARVGPMPRVHRVDRAHPGPIRAISGFERDKKRSFHGATREFRTTMAHASLLGPSRRKSVFWNGTGQANNACSCLVRGATKKKKRDEINLMTRANVGVGAMRRGRGDTFKRRQKVVCAPCNCLKTVGCRCGGWHNWWFLLASPASL